MNEPKVYPGWVYDLVLVLAEHKDFHKREDTCVAKVFAEVPTEVVYAAKARREAQ